LPIERLRWLRDTAARLGVYLGGSYLLASGEDFLLLGRRYQPSVR
jgi:hypothetical protein